MLHKLKHKMSGTTKRIRFL